MLKKVDLHESGASRLSKTYTYKKRLENSPYISGLVEKEVIECNGTKEDWINNRETRTLKSNDGCGVSA